MRSNAQGASGRPTRPRRPALCLYHDDPDGCCAAAIVRRALGEAVLLHAMEIGDAIPWDLVEASQRVVMVDFSLPLEEMRRLDRGRELAWIDHHTSALAQLAEAMAGVPGERSTEEAACELTWRTYFPDVPPPLAVILVGDRDTWRMAHEETRAFSEGLFQEDFNPENDGLWKPLLDDDRSLVNRLIERGRVLYEARIRSIQDVVVRNGFAVSFEGHRALAVNHPGSGDMGEHIRRSGYAIAYCYVEVVRGGRLQTVVSLYSESVDVSEIARKFGGGGHRGAAGFQFQRGDRPFPPGSVEAEPQ